MISKFGSAGAILEDEELVRKLFDTVPETFINLGAQIEPSSDMESMPFKEAIGNLKAYEDRLRLRKANSSVDNALLLAKTEGSSSHGSPSKTGVEEEVQVATQVEDAVHVVEGRLVEEVAVHDKKQLVPIGSHMTKVT